jgi:hypothetical protein
MRVQIGGWNSSCGDKVRPVGLPAASRKENSSMMNIPRVTSFRGSDMTRTPNCSDRTVGTRFSIHYTGPYCFDRSFPAGQSHCLWLDKFLKSQQVRNRNRQVNLSGESRDVHSKYLYQKALALLDSSFVGSRAKHESQQ